MYICTSQSDDDDDEEDDEYAPSTTNFDDILLEPSFIPKPQFSIDSLLQERRAKVLLAILS